MQAEKTCPGCHRALPLTRQYFYGRVSASDGFHQKCKECEGHPFTHVDPPGMRTCSKCGAVLPETAAYFRQRGTKVRGGLRPECRECDNARDKAWYADHPEYFREYRQVNRGRIAAYMQEYWPRYFDTEKGAHAHRNATRRYRQTDGGKMNARFGQQRRRSVKADLLIAFTPADWQSCVLAFDHQCAYCGRTDRPLGQDHVIALTKGGTYTTDNIVPACPQCNTAKFDHDFLEWYAEQPSFDLDRLKRIATYLAGRREGDGTAS